MKNILKILCLCCLSLLFLSAMNSCQDDNEEIEEAVLPDGQEQDSTSGNLTASIVDGLYVNWSKGDMIMLVYDGQAVERKHKNPAARRSFQAPSGVLSPRIILCMACIPRITWCPRTVKA